MGTPGHPWAFSWSPYYQANLPLNVHEPRVLPNIIFNYYMVLLKNSITHSVKKNITDSPLGPALISLC